LLQLDGIKLGKIKRKKQDFIKFGTKLCGLEGCEKAKVYYKGTTKN
jgi:hypothetical protein